jgi:hypothetical protein
MVNRRIPFFVKKIPLVRDMYCPDSAVVCRYECRHRLSSIPPQQSKNIIGSYTIGRLPAVTSLLAWLTLRGPLLVLFDEMGYIG